MRNILLAIVFVGVVPFASAAEETFRNEEVTCQSGAVTLAGTLSIPAGAGPFRAVVLLSGSGPQNRDSELMGFRPFKIMAEYFVQQGIAMLRCESDDTLMALGRSLVAAQVAVMREAQRKSHGEGEAFSEGLLKQMLGQLKSRWMRFFVGFDPSTALRRVACPVFAAFGTLDVQVPAAANRIRLEASLAEAGNTDVTVTVYPEANHLFMRAVTGQLTEYATLPKTFLPALLEDLAASIARR